NSAMGLVEWPMVKNGSGIGRAPPHTYLPAEAPIAAPAGELMSSTDTDAFLHDILVTVKTIAVVGAADKESRPSQGVVGFLVKQGFDVIGVNPNLLGLSVHGEPFYKTLAEVPEVIDMVVIFRNSEAAGGAVDEVLALEPKPKSFGCSSVFKTMRQPSGRAPLA